MYFLLFLFLSHASFAERPKIMLTGYWPPTNELVREFSRNQEQNPSGWRGENWEGSGFDVVSFFPEFQGPQDGKGRGDFEVDFADTKADLERITAEVQPVALLSFGQGQGPWEIEWRFPDFWNIGEGEHQSTLPVTDIASAVNESTRLTAWVDFAGDPGNFLCGYISYLGAVYRSRNSALRAQGFIHVGTGFQPDEYKAALYATLRELIRALKK